MGRTKCRKNNVVFCRRSRSQRLRRIREKCERELLIASQSSTIEPVHNQHKRQPEDAGELELHTFSEIIIPVDNESASPDGELNPLSTPLLDSKISSYINYHSRIQSETRDHPPSELLAAYLAVSVTPVSPGKSLVNSPTVVSGYDKMTGRTQQT